MFYRTGNSFTKIRVSIFFRNSGTYVLCRRTLKNCFYLLYYFVEDREVCVTLENMKKEILNNSSLLLVSLRTHIDKGNGLRDTPVSELTISLNLSQVFLVFEF